MTLLHLAGVALVTVLASSPGPSQPPSEEAGGSSQLAGLAPLVGRTWQGSFPGGELRDTQEFEWMLGGAFLRNAHRVTDAGGRAVYEGETVYGWDPEARRLRFWYFNSTGGFVTGDLEESEGRWLAEGENHGPRGQTSRVRSEIALEGDGWTLTSFFFEEGEWTKRFTMEFTALD